MLLKLVGTDGNRFYTFPLEEGMYTIGRDKERDFFINDKTVSRMHAKITYDDASQTYYLDDNGSRNGTALNGRLLTGQVAIKMGDQINFGNVEFKVTDFDQSASGTKLKTARLSDIDPEKSVFLPINEALKPLPSKVTDLPDVLPTMFDMAKILVLPEPKEQMLERALKLVAKVIPAERLAVISSHGDNDVQTEAVLLPGGKDIGSFNLSKTIVDEIMTEKNSILIDTSTDERYAKQESIIASEIKSAMAVPLFDEGQVLGILYVDTTSFLHRYTDDYLRLLATFGNLIASRLLNYELMHERQEKQVFEAELKRASQIQRNLLLKTSPTYEGYALHTFQEQCKMVGGDLFDISCLADGRLLFLIADVSGKGMGGALLMSNILAAFRILYNDEKFELVKIVKQISRQLFRYSRAEDFATLFIGTIDNRNNKLTYVNAGHNPPFLMRADGTLEFLEPSGIMIGAFDFAEWEESELTMNPGDTLLVFTDGVVEADRHGKLYGEDRLEEIMKKYFKESPNKLVDSVVKDVLDYVADSPRSDDITMLALKRD